MAQGWRQFRVQDGVSDGVQGLEWGVWDVGFRCFKFGV